MTRFFDFLCASPTAHHAAETVARRLDGAGYTRLSEGTPWQLAPGGAYYVTRGAALMAFRLPKGVPTGAMVVATHGDSPTFSVTPAGTAKAGGGCARLTVEKYGGMLCATWLDRPLSVAGVITLRAENGAICTRTVKVDRDLVIIPSVAIHMNRNANEGATYNAAVDMQPLWGVGEAPSLLSAVAEAAGVSEEDILSHRLWLYNRQSPSVLGAAGELVAAPRLDDLACVWCSLEGFLGAKPSAAMPVFALFDNEEVGSSTLGGAGGDFLSATLARACECLGMTQEQRQMMQANSFVVSADNAHATHPNHPEYAHPNNAPVLGGGVVVKYNGNCRYATDAVSAAVFGEVCRRAEVPTQTYCNRPDLVGGSTLGAVSVSQFTVPTVDIGMPQLAMHSAYETAAVADFEHMTRALTAFYGSSLTRDGEDTLILS